MRARRGLRYSVTRLMALPLPAASRPSKTTTRRAPSTRTHSWSLTSSAWRRNSSFSYTARGSRFGVLWATVVPSPVGRYLGPVRNRPSAAMSSCPVADPPRRGGVPVAAEPRYPDSFLRRDRHVPTRRLGGDDGHRHLEDAAGVPGHHVLGVRTGGQPDGPLHRAVPELRTRTGVLLLAAVGHDGEDPFVDGDLDVLARVQPRQLGPQHVLGVRESVLHPDQVAGPDREVGVEPPGQVAEQAGCQCRHLATSLSGLRFLQPIPVAASRAGPYARAGRVGGPVTVHRAEHG